MFMMTHSHAIEKKTEKKTKKKNLYYKQKLPQFGCHFHFSFQYQAQQQQHHQQTEYDRPGSEHTK